MAVVPTDADLAALGAFFSGIGAVLGAMFTLKRVHRKDRDDCEQRIADIKEFYRAGYTEGLSVERRHER